MNQNEKKNWILFALVVSLFISLLKFIGFYLTNSTAVLSDATESIMNLVASLFALYSISLSSKPKDLNHPYGHGKVEFFALGFEGALILVTGIWILNKSIISFFHPHQIVDTILGISLVSLTGITNWILGIFLIRKSKKLNSITLFAEGKHLISDTINSLGIVSGLIVIHFTHFLILDSIISLIICFWMLINGYKLIRRSIAGLMDEADTLRVEEIITILNRNRKENWVDIHNLRVQTYGEEIHLDAHITLPYYFDLKETNNEVQSIKNLISQELKIEVELFFQADPCDPECCHYCRKTVCPVRSTVQTKNLVWNYNRLVLNQKHYLEPE